MTMEAGGRRERNKQAKRERILAAAHDLFDEHGYDGVTTQQISERADVAAGTLFRYASSKGELLLMVNNVSLAEAIEAGVAEAEHIEDPVAAILALVTPVFTAGLAHPENTAAYQRELIFGARDEPHRAEAVAIIDVLRSAVAGILRGARVDADVAGVASHSVFAVVHFALIAEQFPTTDPRMTLREQIEQIVRGALSVDRAHD